MHSGVNRVPDAGIHGDFDRAKLSHVYIEDRIDAYFKTTQFAGIGKIAFDNLALGRSIEVARSVSLGMRSYNLDGVMEYHLGNMLQLLLIG